MAKQTIWQRIRDRLARQPQPQMRPRQTKVSPFLWPDFRTATPQWSIIDFSTYVSEGFNANAVIYAAIMYKARAAMSVPMRAYEGDAEAPELLDSDHPLSKLCDRPNPHQSWSEFIMQCTVYLNIAGECFIYMDRARPNEMPEAMYALRPDRVDIMVENKRERGKVFGTLKGYWYTPENETWQNGVPILPQDMMFVKFPNPLDPLEGMGRGLSPLSASAWSTDVDNSVTKFLKMFFDRGAVVTALLKFNTELDDPTISRIRERWKEIYGGSEQWAENSVGVLDSGGDYQRIGLTFNEMDFNRLDARNESRIVGPFGVPLNLIESRPDLVQSTYSNKEQDRRMFWQDVFVPELTLFEVEFKYYLTGKQGEFVAFDFSNVYALQENEDNAWTRAGNGVTGGWVTVNEARAEIGLDPVEGGDIFLRQPMLAVVPANEPLMISAGATGEVGIVEAAAPQEATPTEEGAAAATEETRKALPIPVKKKPLLLRTKRVPGATLTKQRRNTSQNLQAQPNEHLRRNGE